MRFTKARLSQANTRVATLSPVLPLPHRSRTWFVHILTKSVNVYSTIDFSNFLGVTQDRTSPLNVLVELF